MIFTTNFKSRNIKLLKELDTCTFDFYNGKSFTITRYKDNQWQIAETNVPKKYKGMLDWLIESFKIIEKLK